MENKIILIEDDPQRAKKIKERFKMQKENKRILVLEDSLERHRQFKERFIENGSITYTIVENAEDCKALLLENEYDVIMLDHDLGGEIFVDSNQKNTGAEVSRWIAENKSSIKGDPVFIIHSLNPNGSKIMEQTIKSEFHLVYRIPFVWLKHEFDKIGF
jgi:CheY-like chemotaxis protein